MEIKKLSMHEVSEFRSLIGIFNEVFGNGALIPGSEYLSSVLSKPDFIVFVVVSGGRVIGGLTMHVLPAYYSGKSLAYIYDVGIATEHQRKGLGKALMSEACAYCRQNDFECAYVEAETDDIDAIEFYRKTAYSSEMNATHFTYDF